MALWRWDRLARQYIDPAGNIIDLARMRGLRDQFVGQQAQSVTGLTDRLLDGSLSIQEWERALQNETRIAYVDEYVMGRGGRASCTQRDWGIVGRMLRDQYAFTRELTEEIIAGELAPGTIKMRARMFTRSAIHAYERAMSEAAGLPRLPQYPGDGQTACRGNCQCFLSWEENPEAWHIYWNLGVAEHCEDCIDMTRDWNPYIVGRA